MVETAEPLVECAFLIPLRRDAALSDGLPHRRKLWDWLANELFLRFGGGTIAPGYYHGFYQDPDTGERVADKSKKYVVAIPEQSVGELRVLLSLCCVIFAQKCIYLSIAGRVEFLKSPDDGQTTD